MDKSIHSKFLIWKSVIIIHVNYMRYRCLSETRSYLIVCRSVVSLILCDGRLPYNKEEKKNKRISNRCMYIRSMNNSGMCEFVRILRTRPCICYKHTPRDQFAGFVNCTREPSCNKMRKANKV